MTITKKILLNAFTHLCFIIATLTVVYVLSGCTNMPEFSWLGVNSSGDVAGKVYKKDLELEVNGKKGKGVLVVPKARSYEVKITLKDRVELLKLRTCHREMIAEKEGFRGRRKHTFTFKAEVGLENEGHCLIEIGAFDVQGRHAWATIDIQNETLVADIQCNGVRGKSKGVSLCQTRSGLLQRITFTRPVTMESTCGDAQGDSARVFDISAKTGLCTYVFKEKDNPIFHRFSIFGYTDILLHVIKAKNQ